MKITIGKMKIVNFRNISNLELDFKNKSVEVVGDNGIGKSNVLESLVWLITDRLLDNSMAGVNLLPIGNDKAECKVEVEFYRSDNKMIKLGKTLKKKFVKVRGTDKIEFKGMEKVCFTNGVEVPTLAAFDLTFNMFMGISDDFVNTNSAINKGSFLTNPLYLGNMGDDTNWKNVRALIIKLIGEVDNCEVYELDKKTRIIESDMSIFGSNDLTKKSYKDSIKTLTKELSVLNRQIEALESIPQPTKSEVELENAKIEKEKELSGYFTKTENEIRLETLINEKARLTNEIAAIEVAEEKQQVEIEKTRLTDIPKQLKEHFTIANKIKEKISFADGKIIGLKEKRNLLLSNNETHCHYCKQKLPNSLSEEEKEQAIKNASEIEQEIVNTTNERLQLGKELGERLDTMENLQKVLLNRDTEIVEHSQEHKDKTHELNGCLAEIKELEVLVNNEAKCKTLKSESTRSELALINSEINKLYYYNAEMKTLDIYKKNYDEKSSMLIDYELKLIACDNFTKKKIELYNKKIEKVFGDVRFQLVKENIKENSWDEVCKPYIIGKDVLWSNGSKSEKITTGVAIIEKIKKILNLNDLPIIFDEGGEISTNTYKTKFNTESQIISVRVKDNISTPEIEFIERK